MHAIVPIATMPPTMKIIPLARQIRGLILTEYGLVEPHLGQLYAFFEITQPQSGQVVASIIRSFHRSHMYLEKYSRKSTGEI